ncbi:hypothetical protein ACWT_5826 [Actinoplanes sp. SE50]|uniref:hypothetical protein n=1 Tax=unclassified Actinoplanes TaxID=2626549 RepID=UPI00023EBC1D|nr:MULTISPECIES: hypothetical protein [unclassified Actinoplanes]AEV86844.1 hypothetical protein ACPL_5957 [Actinoplanes sp. SE50/110]ATO85241.1 hypothetical protein ACWT_5826 [Actinoplanes sp. SE50]SLM02651.1 hypothetical protein ACSP50_5933 [Actinoplanes sp. SE50/110]
MTDADTMRALTRYLDDASRRERAADERNKAIVGAIEKGFASLVKELHDGITLIQHTLIDELRDMRR